MRTLIVRLALKPQDDAFDPLTSDEMEASLTHALRRGYPFLLGRELELTVEADSYCPPDKQRSLADICDAFETEQSKL